MHRSSSSSSTSPFAHRSSTPGLGVAEREAQARDIQSTTTATTIANASAPLMIDPALSLVFGFQPPSATSTTYSSAHSPSNNNSNNNSNSNSNNNNNNSNSCNSNNPINSRKSQTDQVNLAASSSNNNSNNNYNNSNSNSNDDPYAAYIVSFPVPPPWRAVPMQSYEADLSTPYSDGAARRTNSFNLNMNRERVVRHSIEYVNEVTGERTDVHPLLRLRQMAGIVDGSSNNNNNNINNINNNNNNNNNMSNNVADSRPNTVGGKVAIGSSSSIGHGRDIISMLQATTRRKEARSNDNDSPPLDECKDGSNNTNIDNNNNNNNNNNASIAASMGTKKLVRGGTGKGDLQYTDFYCSWKEIQMSSGQTGYSMRIRHFIDNSVEISFSGLDGCWQFPVLEGPYGPINKYDMYIGAKVTVFGRHMTINSASASTCRRIDDTAAMLQKKAEWCRIQIEKVGAVPCIKRPDDMGGGSGGSGGKNKSTGTFNLRKMNQDISKLGEQLAVLGMSHMFIDRGSDRKDGFSWKDVPIRGIHESVYHI